MKTISLNGTWQVQPQRLATRGWLRKPPCAYGWDWGESLPNIGIWRGVRLEGRSHAVIHDLRLDTDIVGKRVFVKTAWVIENLHAFSERRCILELSIVPPVGRPIRRRYRVTAQVGRSPHRDAIEISDPQLWWPNGMGAQPLYHVTARLLNGRNVCDRREFGWRRVDGTDARLRAQVVTLPANGMVEIAREPIPPQRDLHPCEWIYGATLAGDGIENDQSTWQAVPFRKLATADSAVSVTQCRNGEIEISSSAYRHMVHAEDHGRPILSDNYFDLLPGVPARVRRVDGKRRAPRFSAA